MPAGNSTRSPASSKPAKPYPDFPLFPHATGRWAKKIRGRLVYFGPWADPDAALTLYLSQKDALHAGLKVREAAASAGTSLKDLCNQFLAAKLAAVESGELTNHSWRDYKAACDLIVAQFGKGRLVSDLDPEDFAKLRGQLAKGWGPVTLGNVIQRMRVVFKFAWDNGLIDRPVRYGQGFKRPTRKTLRLHRAEQGVKLFTAEEIRRLVEAGGPPMKAMILLGINCGFGNSDCGKLRLPALDLDGGWVNYPRPKTGIHRRCPLWPETARAIREALANRPTPKHAEHEPLVFVTQRGLSWAKDSSSSPVSQETRKLLAALHINGRKGLGFYTLRHTFRTVADESKDQPAVDFIMGHEVPHMSSVYRERISDDRLMAATDYVRKWLFGKASTDRRVRTTPSPAKVG
jgi:integrase